MGGEEHGDIKSIEVGWEERWSAEREDHLARWIIAQQEAGGSIENQADGEAHQLTESEGSKSKPVCFLFSKTLLPSHLILSQAIREGAQPRGEQLHAAG